MRLLTEIIDLLSSSEPSLQNALFKAQVLAFRLREDELKSWVSHELTGYPDISDLPSYRVIPVTVMGNASNGVYRYSSQPLPTWGLDERLRRKLESTRLTQSIAVIEQWSKSKKEVSVVIAPEFYSKLSKLLSNGYDVERAWGEHSKGAMLQVVVEVRSRLLEFALELSQRIPADPAEAAIPDISKEVKVNEVFRNAVFGDNATILVGSGAISSISNSVVKNDFGTLASALKKSGVSDGDVRALQEAIERDEPAREQSISGFGDHVRAWIGGMVAKAGTTGWHVSVEAAGGLLAAALSAYYGLST